MNTQVMHEALHGSSEGRLTFPEVIGMLIGAGVESYCVDFIGRKDTFYMPDGETHVEPVTLPAAPVAKDFAGYAVKATIREAQADRIRYPEIVNRLCDAGVAGYHVYLTGRKVIYFGRKGELHIEEFPRQN
ncbi:MAG TPA: hypothetical protein VMD97_09880 [Candidatus Aquilonibacter sp.]|nr:hypothetical protein [Candidatus Aquilonibacter sp.]